LTEPVPELLEELGWTGGEAIADGRMFLHYVRTMQDGRVLMGSASGPIGFRGRIDARFTHDRPTARRAEAGLRRLLPALARARVEHAWGGPIDVSSDHLPFFGTDPGSQPGRGRVDLARDTGGGPDLGVVGRVVRRVVDVLRPVRVVALAAVELLADHAVLVVVVQRRQR